jgi:hypothetical protein
MVDQPFGRTPHGKSRLQGAGRPPNCATIKIIEAVSRSDNQPEI